MYRSFTENSASIFTPLFYTEHGGKCVPLTFMHIYQAKQRHIQKNVVLYSYPLRTSDLTREVFKTSGTNYPITRCKNPKDLVL